jgi:predicted dehydrogenase
MDPINVGVIGCGYWGPNLIRNFIELPKSNVFAVADLKPDRLEYLLNRFPGIHVTTHYADFFDMPIEAVVVATPPATHYTIAREFLLRGVHVLVEKPLTLLSKHAEELVNLARTQDVILMTGHTFEYNTAVIKLRDLIESGELGEIYYIDAIRVNLGLFQSDLNVLWDLAPHDLSILSFILGQGPISVSAFGASCVFPNKHDIVYLNLNYPDHILAHIRISWLDPCKLRRITVVGSKQMVVYDDVDNLEKIKIFDKGVELLPFTDTFGEFHCSYRYGDITIPCIRSTEPLRMECEHFLDCIRTGCEPQSGGLDGLRVVQVLEAAENSLRNGGRTEFITYDLETTTVH